MYYLLEENTDSSTEDCRNYTKGNTKHVKSQTSALLPARSGKANFMVCARQNQKQYIGTLLLAAEVVFSSVLDPLCTSVRQNQ